MSESRTILCDTADDVFAKVGAADFAESWPLIAKAGFSTLLIDEADGGFGGDWGDYFAIMHRAGGHALALPVGEDMLATYLINAAGLSVPEGVLSVSRTAQGTISGDRFTGTMQQVPWGRNVDHVIGVLDGRLIVANARNAALVAASSPAGDPVDTLIFQDCVVSHAATTNDVHLFGAIMRVAQIAGALDHILRLSIDHANNRVQFGRPLAKFQAVQQNLALLAVESGAVYCAGQAAADALCVDCRQDQAVFEISSAKLRANIAVGVGTSIAHQVHGAIGFTQDFSLHRYTRRLIGWRSDYGNDRYWSERLGKMTAGFGGAGLWDEMTYRSDQRS